MPIFPQETGIPQSIFKEPRSGCWRVWIAPEKLGRCGERNWTLWPNQYRSDYQDQNRTQHPWGRWHITTWRNGHGQIWFSGLVGSGQRGRWLWTSRMDMGEVVNTRRKKYQDSISICDGILPGGKFQYIRKTWDISDKPMTNEETQGRHWGETWSNIWSNGENKYNQFS